MAESEVDDLILEIQKSGLDDQFLVLAADTLKELAHHKTADK